MKNTSTIALLLMGLIAYGQDCTFFNQSEDLVQGHLKQRVLIGEEGFLNPLYIKSGIGNDGDLESRTYAPLIKSSHIWTGGLTPTGNLKLATSQYDEHEWCPGPLDINGITNENICNAWNKIWTVSKDEIIEARKIFENNGDCSTIPPSVLNWPARGNPYLSLPLLESSRAGFWDENQDGLYTPCEGDIPLVVAGGCHLYDFGEILSQVPSELSYYVMNDNGVTHNVSQSIPIQMIIHVHSYYYNTQESEGIIFHKYSVINKSSEDIRDFKFAAWIDFDLGCPDNDLLGSVPDQNMVYAYNANNNENCGMNNSILPNTMVGYSFLTGPKGPYIILEDINGQDSLVSPPIGSGTFDTLISLKIENVTIPTNCNLISNTTLCNPQIAGNFFNLLNTKSFEGNTINDHNGIPTQTMYSGNPANPIEWSACSDTSLQESTAILSFKDLLMSPEANNEFYSATFYIDDGGLGCPDASAIKYKQRKAQRIYNNCFHNFNGPSPPEIRVIYNDDNNGVTIDIISFPIDYRELVPQSLNQMLSDIYYTFEGVKIYQVASKNFDMTELDNPDMSVLVYQGDITNDISNISNHKSSFDGEEQNWFEEIKVVGTNDGIKSQLSLTYDFIRNQTIDPIDELYYVAISYGYNNYLEFDPFSSIDLEGNPLEIGQQYRYIQSTHGLKTEESVISVSNTLSPYESGLYDYIYNGNIINIFDIEENLSLQITSIDGKPLEQWNANKGECFTSINLSERLVSGLYILNITATYSGLNGSHKLVVVQ